MRKARIAQLVGITAAVPMLLFANTGSAFADGSVTWKDHATQRCLSWKGNGSDGYNLGTDGTVFGACGATSATQWVDSQLSNNNWAEQPNGTNDCLTAYYGTGTQGQAYIEGCSEVSPDQQRKEEFLGNGNWWLVNAYTGQCLDSDSAGDVYTNPCQSGNQYQIWN